MLVFIDESGDPGFKLDRGATPVFVGTMVIFTASVDAAASMRQAEARRERFTKGNLNSANVETPYAIYSFQQFKALLFGSRDRRQEGNYSLPSPDGRQGSLL
jgi:hypothetical protein